MPLHVHIWVGSNLCCWMVLWVPGSGTKTREWHLQPLREQFQNKSPRAKSLAWAAGQVSTQGGRKSHSVWSGTKTMVFPSRMDLAWNPELLLALLRLDQFHTRTLGNTDSIVFKRLKTNHLAVILEHNPSVHCFRIAFLPFVPFWFFRNQF